MPEKKYGHFNRDSREYVITDPRTPMPWMNYLFNDEYCALISATGGGYSFHKSARDKRILRYRLNNLPMDRPGRYCYLRRNDTGEYWSATWAPVCNELADGSFSCVHGFGYTRVAYEHNGIRSLLTYTVPPGDNCELWHLQLENRNGKAADLTVFPYAEFCVWIALNDLSNFQLTYNVVRCACSGNAIRHTTYTEFMPGYYAFLASSVEPEGWDCDRERFIGRCRSESNPEAVERGGCSNTDCHLGNPVAAFQIPVTLEAGAVKEISFLLGVGDGPGAEEPLTEKYFAKGAVDRILDEHRSSWDRLLAAQVVKTPDPDTDYCLNTWHQYQAQVTFRVSRGPSIYEGGIGRGMGYRDSCQDIVGVIHAERGRVKALLRDLVANQYAAGNSVVEFFRLTGTGEGSDRNDTHLWLIGSVAAYLKESGDFGFLDEKIPFADSGQGTVYEHLEKAAEFTGKTTGSHGLPLIGVSDWNDSLRCGEKGRGESVMIAAQYIMALDELAAIARMRDDRKTASRYEERAQAMRNLVRETCWDGKWFLRAFDDGGLKVGSAECEYGKIFLNPQSWSVMSGIADHELGLRAMDAVAEHLDTPYGIVLVSPAWKHYEKRIGGGTAITWGLKENGGIFCHAHSWAIVAEAMLGRGDRAYEYYAKLRPTEYDRIQDLHETEPYVYSQTIAGPEHERHGTARNSWLTGTVAWQYVAATQYILGIRPEYEGLRIDPCIPAGWDGFSVKRRFRNGALNIRVQNPGHVCRGIKSVTLDGKPHKNNLLPPPDPNRTHEVVAVMGA